MLPWCEGAMDEAVQSARAAISAVGERPDVRFVLVAEGRAVHVLLRLLAAHPGLRDRTLAVVSIGGTLAGLPDVDGVLGARSVEDWMGRWFGHDTLGTDAIRATPYLSMQWLDPQRADDLASGRFPEPVGAPGVPEAVDVQDLGALWADPDVPRVQVARALIGVVGGLVLSRR